MKIVHQEEAEILEIDTNKSSTHCSCTLLAWLCYLDEIYYPQMPLPPGYGWKEDPKVYV